MRNQRQDPLGNLADAGRIDDVRLPVKGELGSILSSDCCPGGCRIIDITVGRLCLAGEQALDAAEIAGAESIGWDGKLVEPPAEIVNPQNIPEEKQLILDDGSAHGATIIVVGRPRESEGWTVEELASRQCADPVELICRAMKVIGSRLQADVGHGPSDSPEFARVVACAYVYILNPLPQRDA